MTFVSGQRANWQSFTISQREGATAEISRLDQVRLLQSIWELLEPRERRVLLQQPGNELVSPIINSLQWMSKWTKTRDDQDHDHPFKHLDRPYLATLHQLFMQEALLYVEKSRSMVTTWWATAEATHLVMTHQPAKAIFWAQDEDRALVLRDYAWTLYEQQDDRLKALFPVVRPRQKQSYDRIEWADGGSCVAIPGKDPDKIRSEHPTIVVMDEACFIEHGGEALDVALASRVPRVLIVSTAAPSWIRRLTREAVPEQLPQIAS